MTENYNQPKEYDVVLGGQVTAPAGGVVLGGLDRVKQMLVMGEVEPRTDALLDALQYGQLGLDLVIQALDDKSEKVHSCCLLATSGQYRVSLQTGITGIQPLSLF